MPDPLKPIGDVLSVSTCIATIAGWLPAVAALVTIIWTGIRIWETKTVQRLIQHLKDKRGG